MRSEFRQKYAKATKAKVIFREPWCWIKDDFASPEPSEQGEVEERAGYFLLEADDDNLLFDLHANNGCIKDEKLMPFWEELEKFLEEHTVVKNACFGQTKFFTVFFYSPTFDISKNKNYLPRYVLRLIYAKKLN